MRKKTMSALVALVAAIIVLSACVGNFDSNGNREDVDPSGNEVTEARNVSGFSAISLQSLGEVIVDQTGSESLEITADENFLPYLESEVRGNTLYLSVPKGVNFQALPEITYRITAANLDSLEVSGAGSVRINNLDTDQWTVRVPGASNITVNGQATTQSIELSGAGNYNGENLTSRKASVISSGAGAAVVQVSDQLDVTISGLGNVEYIGDPTVHKIISGLGAVNQR